MVKYGVGLDNSPMTYADRKSLRVLLIVGAVLFLCAAPFYVTEFFYPKILGANGTSFLIFGGFCLTEGTILVLTRAFLGRCSATRFCRYYSRYEFIMNPILTFSVLSLSAIFPQADHDWLFFTNIGITAALIAYRVILMSVLTYRMNRGEHGLISIRNHSVIGLSFLLVALNYYAFSFVKTIGVDMVLISQGSIAGLSEWFVLTTVAEMGLGMVLLLQALFMALATHYSGVADVAIDLKLNLGKSKELIARFSIPFYISIFATFILFLMSFVSMVYNPAPYLALTILYFLVLAVRIPIFIANRRIEKKESDPERSFARKHGPMIYGGVFLLAYAVICIVFGGLSFEAAGSVEWTTFMTFGVFLPWSIIKMAMGTKSYIQSRKSNDPVEYTNALIDILLSLFTLGQTMAIFATQARGEVSRVIAIVFSALVGLYCLSMAIQMFVMGVLGSKGQRLKALSLFLRQTQIKEEEKSSKGK